LRLPSFIDTSNFVAFHIAPFLHRKERLYQQNLTFFLPWETLRQDKRSCFAIEDFAISSTINVTILAAKTLNKVEDIAGFVTDAEGHALWVNDSISGNGFLKLVLNSDAFLSFPVTIPIDATSMQFKYQFQAACDPQTQLEVYMNNDLLYYALAGEALEAGEQFSGWMNVMDYAGQQVDITFRLSNPVDGPLGEILLDDILFTKLSNAAILGDLNSDNFVDLKDVINGLQVLTLPSVTEISRDADVNDDDDRIGLEEVQYDLDQILQLEE